MVREYDDYDNNDNCEYDNTVLIIMLLMFLGTEL